jgi:hypothetical protein
MVSAVVVRSMALVLGLFSSWPRTSGSVSHRFDSITRWKPLISGASAPNISPRHALDFRRASGWLVEPCQRIALMLPMALCPRRRGIDAWPGGGVERQKESDVALLGQADERGRLRQAGHHAVGEHQQAFVDARNRGARCAT